MASLDVRRHEIGIERGDAFATAMADASVDEAIRTDSTQRLGTRLARFVMIRIVFGWIAAAQVVQGAAHASFVATHFDTKRRFAGIGEELRAVVHGFANRERKSTRLDSSDDCATRMPISSWQNTHTAPGY